MYIINLTKHSNKHLFFLLVTDLRELRMAERYKRSPTKASTYAFRTLRNRNANFVTARNSTKEGTQLKTQLVDSKENVLHVINGSYSQNTRTSYENKYDKSNQVSDRSVIVDKTLPLNEQDNNVINSQSSSSSEDNHYEDENLRRNVWSDVDDEVYIAKLIKLRTSNEVHERDKRDTSAYISDSDIDAKVVSSVKIDKYEEMWDLEPTDLAECDCLGPPPEFLLPPPPRPPFLQTDYYCGDDPIPDLETCDTEPVSYISNKSV